ncbi:hypothetical protein PIB30_001500 [Stylosanthes scabra]|uniref:glucan endo-1,3-beta-D-glucosidase n=1 Tax=Stylosanthes scabra TaxID=79078 RepID=A0ABU6Q3R4_9FABA|nr:hypothetical protein [Stylosanthes scabra]
MKKIKMENIPVSSIDLLPKFKRIRTERSKHASNFFSQNLRSSPLPLNSFFQNFLLDINDLPTYIHPYSIKPSPSSLSICYSSRFVQSPNFIGQLFNPHLTISSLTTSQSHHVISSFTDISVTLDSPASNLTFFLVRGCPYVTLSVSTHTPFSFTSIHKFSSFTSNSSLTKYTLKLDNDQTWLIYSSLPIKFSYTNDIITSDADDGDEINVILRIAVLPDSSSELEDVLDKYSTCYPVSGDASLAKPYCVEYKWDKRGLGDLLMLAHPLHLQLLSKDDGNVAVLQDFKYKSIDGDLGGVVGDSWSLKADHVPVLGTLSKVTMSVHDYAKSVARAARLALIAEEVGFLKVIPAIKKFLHETIQPLLDGDFDCPSFLYDAELGGIINKTRSYVAYEKNRFETFYTHHYEFGYFLYGIAVLAKIDPSWGMKYKPHAYSFMKDFIINSKTYTRLGCFDLYKLHSWSGEHSFIAQDSTSESVNAYYSAALMGLAYGDINLAAIGATLSSLEIHAAKMWFHVKEGDNLYQEDFVKASKLLDFISVNSRHTEMQYCLEKERNVLVRHVLPLLPISECLFSNVDFVKELVEWINSSHRYGSAELAYALEGMYDNKIALKKIRSFMVKHFDCGNSLSNLLWWSHSRDNQEKCCCDHGSRHKN